jgi:hypothetical protein
MNAPYPFSAFRIPVRPNALLASMAPDELRQTMRYLGCRSQQSLADRMMRREAELVLLDKLYAELAMPEWYPHQ